MRDITSGNILTDWSAAHAKEFGKTSLKLKHGLHGSRLFKDEALERLLECVPRENYHINTMDQREGNPRIKREGEIVGLSGRQILKAVRDGRVWINLQNPHELNGEYGDLLQDIYSEFEARVPGFKSYKHKMTILISSPKLKVKYHFDVPGQTLWQLRGEKRVFVYPAEKPFLDNAGLDGVILNKLHETDIAYDPSFDDHAEIFELKPGEMLHWPLNCPHRVENHDSLNVSLTTEHWTNDLRSQYVKNFGNAVMRDVRGMQWMQNDNRLTYLTKFGITAAAKLTGAGKKAAKPFTIDFKLDPEAPGSVKEIEPYEYRK